MRQIEQCMINALEQGKNWKFANTAVSFNSAGEARIYLHGHRIASMNQWGSITPDLDTLRNWPTPTTKSRLRALKVNVYTKNFITYVDDEAI